MKLCGLISVDLDVGDEAAGHQKRLEDILRQMRAGHPDATLSIGQSRERKALTPAGASLERAR